MSIVFVCLGGFIAENAAAATTSTPTNSVTLTLNPAEPMVLPSTENAFNPAYVGVFAGYGNTNWQQMVSQDASTATSTPTSAGGSGVAEGIMLGYSISRYFALEGDFTHFPSADLVFAPYSVYRPLTETTSKTNAYALLGKFMLSLDNGKFSPFSEIGPGYVQRNDDLAQKGHFGGSFGVGADYYITPHWMAEIGLQYYTGYGDSTLKPAYDYIPFLYTVNARIAYRFSL
ncbi:MAG: porin family protein [Gammaproteobacteria bacterium]|nr:porin family protein [Gammaproteobacteria bacterium]